MASAEPMDVEARAQDTQPKPYLWKERLHGAPEPVSCTPMQYNSTAETEPRDEDVEPLDPSTTAMYAALVTQVFGDDVSELQEAMENKHNSSSTLTAALAETIRTGVSSYSEREAQWITTHVKQDGG